MMNAPVNRTVPHPHAIAAVVLLRLWHDVSPRLCAVHRALMRNQSRAENPIESLPILLAQHGLQAQETLITQMARPSIRLSATPTEDNLPVGASRIGGCPDLPIGMSWPLASDVMTRRLEWGQRQSYQSALPFLCPII